MAVMTPKEATIAQFAPGAEAGERGPEEPYRGPAPGWYRGESLNQALVRGIIDGQG
jgi:hypothetical protein